jgi:hypothetical protein
VPTYYRSDMWQVQLQVTGLTLDNVSWDSFEGGDIAPEMQQYNPGGMAQQISLGGIRKRTEITLKRVWSDFLIGVYVALDALGGNGAAVVSATPMKGDRKTAAGNPIVYTGVIGQVMKPNYDSATGGAALLQVTVTPNEAISGGGN